MLIIGLASVPLLGLIAIDDLHNRRIRNRHLAALGLIIVVGLGVVAAMEGPGVLVRAASGSVLAALPLVVAALLQPAQIGGGDIKLTLVLGALLGGVDPRLSIAAVGAALVVTLVVITLRRESHTPLAPGLVGCGLVALALHATITSASL